MRTGMGYSRIANWAARISGRPATFVFAVSVILMWIVTGPLFHFSDTWQLVIINKSTKHVLVRC